MSNLHLLWIIRIWQYHYFRLQEVFHGPCSHNYLLSLSRRLCLSLLWALPSWEPLCTCTLELGCADCQGPWAAAVLWLLSRVFRISPRGLRSMFGSNRFIRLQLLFMACLHKVSCGKKKDEKNHLFTTLPLT